MKLKNNSLENDIKIENAFYDYMNKSINDVEHPSSMILLKDVSSIFLRVLEEDKKIHLGTLLHTVLTELMNNYYDNPKTYCYDAHHLIVQFLASFQMMEILLDINEPEIKIAIIKDTLVNNKIDKKYLKNLNNNSSIILSAEAKLIALMYNKKNNTYDNTYNKNQNIRIKWSKDHKKKFKEIIDMTDDIKSRYSIIKACPNIKELMADSYNAIQITLREYKISDSYYEAIKILYKSNINISTIVVLSILLIVIILSIIL